MNPNLLKAVLGRDETPFDESLLEQLRGKRVLILGAKGSIGTALTNVLEPIADVIATDVDRCNVESPLDVMDHIVLFQPEYVVNLAGAKHAPLGESQIRQTWQINTQGASIVLRSASIVRSVKRVVTASTCKACDPETVYGASKMIVERETLHSGHSVARFYNVVETSGNVFEIWDKAGEQIEVTPCKRYFISLSEAVQLILHTMNAPAGRWVLNTVEQRSMRDVAEELYPNKTIVTVAPRRGDRLIEPLMATHETVVETRGVFSRIMSQHEVE